MSLLKRLTALGLSFACTLSLSYFSTSATESSIVALSGCGISVSAEENGTYVLGVPEKTSPESAKNLFQSSVQIESDGGWVATGDTLTLYENGTPVETAKIVVNGDVNCDGEVTSKDIIRLKKFLSSSFDIVTAGADLKAADINGDEALTSEDITLLSQMISSYPTNISVIKPQTKISYFAGEKFLPNGMVMLVTYSDGSKRAVCDGFEVKYAYGDTLCESDTYVDVYYGNCCVRVDISIIESTTYDLSEYSDQIITLSSEGAYTFINSSENTQIVVDAPDASVMLVFSDASLCYKGDDAPINIIDASDVTIVSSGESYISDTASNLAESVIYAASVPVAFEGEGAFIINANSSEAITVSKASLQFNGGTFDITSKKNGIQPKGAGTSLVINDGVFNITAGADGIKNSKTDIVINGGDFTIKADGDGIQAETSLTISGGTFDITTSGGHSSDSGNTTSSAWVYELLTSSKMPTTQSEYYGLYVLSGSTYIEIDETNYSTYSTYSSLYDRVSTKGIKANGDITLSNANITLDTLDDGIKSDTVLTVNSGTYTINSACDGIQADDSIVFNGGTVDISLTASYYQNSSNGKFTYKNGEYVRTSSDTGGMGGGFSGSSSSVLYALFNSGKGFKAETDIYINGGCVTVDSVDDAIHSDGSLYITNGKVNISTKDDGLHAELAVVIGSLTDGNGDPEITISDSYEGVEGIYIDFYSGSVDITSSDDGVNAAGDLEASSKYYLSIDGTSRVYVNAEGDGLDANGYMYIYGGETYVFGPSSGGNGVIDYDSKFQISGGTFLALGNKDMAQTATSATQYVLGYTMSSGSFGTGTYVNVNGADITVKLPKSYSSSLLVLVSSPKFSQGNTYKVSYGGTYSGGTVEHNVCSGGVYSSGSSGASITTSSTYITSNGSFSQGGSNRPF